MERERRSPRKTARAAGTHSVGCEESGTHRNRRVFRPEQANCAGSAGRAWTRRFSSGHRSGLLALFIGWVHHRRRFAQENWRALRVSGRPRNLPGRHHRTLQSQRLRRRVPNSFYFPACILLGAAGEQSAPQDRRRPGSHGPLFAGKPHRAGTPLPLCPAGACAGNLHARGIRISRIPGRLLTGFALPQQRPASWQHILNPDLGTKIRHRTGRTFRAAGRADPAAVIL